MDSSFASKGILAGYLYPHPPVLLSGVGRGRETDAEATIASCREASRQLASYKPETIILFSPHSPIFTDYVYSYEAAVLSGSFADFGASGLSFSFECDLELRALILKTFHDEGIAAGSAGARDGESLDHGVLVPLYFIREFYRDFKLVVLSAPAVSADQQYRLGMLVRDAVKLSGKRVCIVASGDMSHKVTAESPYGRVTEGALFDAQIVKALKSSNIDALGKIDPHVRSAAAECGYGPIQMLCGAFDHVALTTTVMGYESPFGIGYCVASFIPSIAPDLRVQIARKTVESCIRDGKLIGIEQCKALCTDCSQGELFRELESERAGVFVSIKKNKELRGCIGTIQATQDSIIEEIIQNAVSAATGDPRFNPVSPDELDSLEFSVDVLGKSEPVRDISELDPRLWGVIVTHSGRRGLLLPDLEGVDTVDAQLSIACRKAHIDPAAPYTIEKFKVTRFH